MKLSLSLALITILTVLLAPNAHAAKDNCADCHAKLGVTFREHIILPAQDIHKQRSISCVHCHGGDEKLDVSLSTYKKAMDPAKGFIGIPSKPQIPGICGKCHSNASYIRYYNPNLPIDQEDQYKISQHGQLLAKGDKKVATCTDCHDHHKVLPAKDPQSPVFHFKLAYTCAKCHSNSTYMKEYGIPTDQLNKYKKSVHGIALFEKGDSSAPVCNNCHGTHGPIQPKAGSVVNVCGQCHVSNWELFMQSPHKAAFASLEIPACEICHSNHEILPPTDKLIGIEKGSICTDCHQKESAGYQAAATMRKSLDDLNQNISLAKEAVDKARTAGMEVSEQDFTLRDAQQALTQARSLIHAFNPDRITDKVQEGVRLASEAHTGGLNALKEIQIRRVGLAASIILIAIIAIILYLKIRKLPSSETYYDPEH